jgi:hypothetical protein
MKIRHTYRSGASAVTGLLFIAACTSQPSTPPSTGTTSAAAAAARLPEPSPTPDPRTRWPDQTPEDFEAAWKLVDKAVAAMGGPIVVDGVRSLVLTSKQQQRSPLGEYPATVTTTILYPASVRRDITLPGGSVSTVLTPEAAWITGVLGTFEMEKSDRDQFEAGAIRLPLTLLKSRYGRLFRASYPGPLLPGTPGDNLIVRLGSEETQLSLDPAGRIVQIVWTGPSPVDPSKKVWIRVNYSDFRTVDGLIYPFASTGWVADEKVSTSQLESIRINAEIDPALFAKPAPAPTPTATPTP